MGKRKKIAILTGGGDCPGLNAVIRAVSKKAIGEYSYEIIGVKDGFEGLIHNNYQPLGYDDVSGILTLGGTILGTSRRANPYKYGIHVGDKVEFKDISKETIKNIHKLNIDCLVCLGGDGTLDIANRLYNDGIPTVGVPKTIDNDVKGTDITFGFNSACAIATDAVDRVHTTAQSHHRIMIVEVMGRYAGWISLYAGIAGGGDVVLIPEIPYSYEVIADVVRKRDKKGRRFSIVVIAEGAKPKGGEIYISKMEKENPYPIRLGGIGFKAGEEIEKLTGIETRTIVLGHLQRGGSPTAFDRVLATRFGVRVVEMIENGEFGCMVGLQGDSLVSVRLSEVAGGQRTIPLNDPLIKVARSVQTCFGD